MFKFRTNKKLDSPEKLICFFLFEYWNHKTHNLSHCELAARKLKNKFPLDFYVYFDNVL